LVCHPAGVNRYSRSARAANVATVDRLQSIQTKPPTNPSNAARRIDPDPMTALAPPRADWVASIRERKMGTASGRRTGRQSRESSSQLQSERRNQPQSGSAAAPIVIGRDSLLEGAELLAGTCAGSVPTSRQGVRRRRRPRTPRIAYGTLAGSILTRRSSRSGRDEIYFTFACAFRRSAQYRFIRAETALRAAADIRRVRRVACSTARRTARRRRGSASSGNVRSIAMISARRRVSANSAPARASSRNRSALNG
jgi:hypothetical protein